MFALTESRRDQFMVSTDKTRLDTDLIYRYLSEDSYWCQGIPRERVEKSIAGSLCFGLYDGEKQIGFARVITDGATIAYLGDVFVLDVYRGQGLSKWLMEIVMQHPDLQGLRRWILLTRDAHGLYRKYGFTDLQSPDRWMEKFNAAVYRS